MGGAIRAPRPPLRARLITAVCVLLLVQIGSLDELFTLSAIAVATQYGSSSLSLALLGHRRRFGLGARDVVLGVIATLAAMFFVTRGSWHELWRAGLVIGIGLVLRAAVRTHAGRP